MSAYRVQSICYLQYYTNYYAEQKQKQALIRQLTAQLQALKLNHKDYVILQSQSQLMTQKYCALQSQKDKISQSLRHKTTLMQKHLTEQSRTLQNLKSQLEESKSQLSKSQQERESLTQELSAKCSQIEQLKKQKLVLIQHEEALRFEAEQLQGEIRETKEDVNKWEILKQEYVDQIATYGGKISQMKEAIERVKQVEEGLKGRVKEVEGAVREAEARVKEIEGEVRELTERVGEQSETNKQQQKQLIERQNQLDRIVDQTNHHQRLLNFQTKKSADLDLALNNALLAHSQKHTELQQLQQLNSLASSETDQLQVQNTRLEKYLEDILSHIENLNRQNAVLEGQMARVEREDGEIRALLGSKMRVVYGVNNSGGRKVLGDSTNNPKKTGDSWVTTAGNSRIADF